MEQLAPICRRSRASDGPALNSQKGMIFPSSLRFQVAGINRTPCHTTRLSVSVNLLAHDGDAVNTINAPDWSSALNTSPLIGLLCQPVQTAALIPILIRHLK